MNARTLTLMVLFFVGLVGLWTLDRMGVPTAEQTRERSGRILPELIDVTPEEIARIEIAGGDQPVLLERDGATWQIREPIRGLADRRKVEGLIQGLKLLPRSTDSGTLEGDAARYGLAPAKRTVRLFRKGGSSPLATLDLGVAVRDRRYVRPGGQTGVDLASARPLATVDAEPRSWREDAIFPMASFEVLSLEASGPKGALRMIRVGGHERLDQPFRAPADPLKFEELVASLCNLKVADYLGKPVGDGTSFGLDRPTRTIRLGGAEARQSGLDVGSAIPGEPGKRFARRVGEDQLLAVAAVGFEPLDVDPEALRGLRVADVVAERVDRLQIDSHGILHELVRDRSGWRVVAPASALGVADGPTVSTLLGQLGTLQASEIRSEKAMEGRPIGLDSPSMVIRAWEGAGSASDGNLPPPVATVVLGLRDRGRKVLYARSDDAPGILILPDSSFDFGPGGAMAFRDRTIFNGTPKRITQLSIDRDGTTVEVVPKGDPPRWRMIAPVSAAVEPDALSAIDIQLAQIRAETLVAQSSASPDEFGLSNPVITVTWSTLPTQETAPVERILRIGAEFPNGRGAHYATLSGHAEVFVLGARAVNVFRLELHDRQVVSLHPDAAAHVQIRGSGQTIEADRLPPLTRESPRWEVRSTHAADGMDASKIDGVIVALGGLRALRYEQYRGPMSPRYGLDQPKLTVDIQLARSPEVIQLRLGAFLPDGSQYATLDPDNSGAVFLLTQTAGEPWKTLMAPSSHRELPETLFAPGH